MNLTAPLLALMFAATTLFGQEATSPDSGNGPLIAQAQAPAAPKDNAVTSINDRGAKDKSAPPAPAPAASDSGSGSGHAASNSVLPSSSTGGFNPVTLWKLIQSGGWAMVILGFFSVVTLMLVFVYLFTLRRGAILTPHYMNTADVLLKKRDYLGLLAISSRHNEAVARVVQRTLDFATKNPTASIEVIKEIADAEVGSQAASLQHRTVYLADIGMLSPMVGLLGTVLGIINSFGELGSGQPQSRDVLLAGGISKALVTTASGLIVGIVAMIFYSLFRNRVQSLISDLEIASTHILGLITLNFNKKREQSRVAVDEEF